METGWLKMKEGQERAIQTFCVDYIEWFKIKIYDNIYL